MEDIGEYTYAQFTLSLQAILDIERDQALLTYNMIRARSLEKSDYKAFLRDTFDVKI